MATLDDILTAQKNGVVAINNLNQVWLYLAGKSSSKNISASTAVSANGSGRVVSVCVVAAGTTAGTIYSGSATSANAISAIPNTIGTFEIGAQFSGGLTVVPGTGQTVSVTYSLD